MDTDQIQIADDQLITADVARAVEERELIAYYQPVVDIETRTVVEAEALVRWTMPDGTIVPAGLFVPSLERTSTILGLDWYMVEEVTGQLERLAGTSAFVPITLNLSPHHATDPEFASKLAAMADWRQLSHAQVGFELRHADFLEGDEGLENLVRAGAAQGFRAMTDNFAGGADELSALAELGVTAAKLSRKLWSQASAAELAALVASANACGITLSAESVEEEADLATLEGAGITRAQGFLFAHPMDGASFAAFCG